MDQRLFRLFGSAHKWVKVEWKKLVTEFSNETFNAQIANLYDFSASLYLHEHFYRMKFDVESNDIYLSNSK